MKKFQLRKAANGILIMLFCLLLIYPADAQSKLHPRIDMGFTIGSFNKSTAPYEDPDVVASFEKSTRVAFEIGYGYDYKINDAFGIYGGLFFSEKGGAYRTQNPDFIYVNQFSGQQADEAYNYLRYRLAYFEVPVLVNYDLFNVIKVKDPEMSLNLFVGISPMVNVASKLRYNVFEGSSEAEEKWESEKLDGAQPFVLAWNAGVEWRGGPLILYGRYNATLTDVYDTSKEGFENFDVDMSTISLGMGVLLKYKTL